MSHFTLIPLDNYMENDPTTPVVVGFFHLWKDDFSNRGNFGATFFL